MYRFFEPVIRPLLDAAKPSVVVEIGSDRGPGTELLAPWCQENGAVLHCVDPLPKYDVEEWAERWPGVIKFHLDLSLNALVDIGAADVVCIDGDHNWYTVFHELELLGRSATAAGQPFPLTLLHDVGWPYGRRDLYYDPDTIPEGTRQPYRKGGIVPGVRALSERGFNDHLDNALHEGTPRNGVRTAAEDFVDQYDGELTFHVVPGLHGLGIIVDNAAEGSVKDAVTEVLDRTGLLRVLDAVEADRITRLEAVGKTQRVLERERARTDRARTEAAKHLDQQLRYAEKEKAAIEQVRSLQANQSMLEARQNTLAERARKAELHAEQSRTSLKQRNEEISRLRTEHAALRTEVGTLRNDLNRLRNRRSVRFVLRMAAWTRPLFRLRRGQFGGRPKRHEQTGRQSTSSKEGAPPSTLVAPRRTTTELDAAADGGRFFTLIRQLGDAGVPVAFADAWRASQTAVAETPAVALAEEPLVSIIMPTYNRADLIGDAVTSVLEQTYRNWELVVCDDESTDHTEGVILGFDDPRISYRRLPKGGAAAARNAGLAEAAGTLIAYLDSDNLWHPRFLETMTSTLAANPGRYLAYSKYVDITISGDGVRLTRFDPRWFDYDRLVERNYIDLNSIVHRRRIYEHLGGFDSRLLRQQDWHLILKYSFLRDPIYIDRYLMLYRRNEAWGQITQVNKDDQTAPAITRSSVSEYYLSGLPAADEDLPSMTVLSWDICRNHFSKAYNVAEAMADRTEVQLLGFRFFDEPIFPPYADADPSFATSYLPGGAFPEWAASLAKAVSAVTGEVLYTVKPRLPSLGVALLHNYHFGTPILLESNDLESVVTNPRTGQEARAIRLADVDPSDPELLNPYGALWTSIMEGLAAEIPLRVTHNHVLDAHFGGGAYFVRNPKDDRHYDPANFDREEIRQRLGFTPDERVLLFGGMVRRHKGVFELAELLEPADSPYRLLVVGSRGTPDQSALESGSGDRVRIIDPVDRNEMAAINLAADAVVLWLNPDVAASRYQMPFKLTDALAMKVPVIANDIGDLGDLGRQGYLRLVPFGDIDALRTTLDELSADRVSTDAMVEAGRRLYLREFSYRAVRHNLSMMLTDAAASSGTLPVATEFAEFFAEFRRHLAEQPDSPPEADSQSQTDRATDSDQPAASGAVAESRQSAASRPAP